MPELFESLTAFDVAAQAQERDRLFQARLFVREVPGEVAVVFNRGAGRNPVLSPEERRAVYARETQAPEWVVTAPELTTLAQAIGERIPDAERLFLFVAKLDSGTWEISYGKDLRFAELGDDLASLMARVLKSLPR